MGKYDNLNYAAFSQEKISRRDFTKEQITLAGLNSNVRRQITNIIIALVLISLLFVPSFAQNSTGIFAFLFIVYAPAVLIIAVMLFVDKGGQKQKLRLLKFAFDNNSLYYATKTLPPTEPIMFNIGHAGFQSETLYLADQTMLAKYQYTISSDDNNSALLMSRFNIRSFLGLVLALLTTRSRSFSRRTSRTNNNINQQTRKFNFMQVKLPRAVPHLFINSKKNSINPNGLGYEIEKLKLEGNFSEYFELLIPPGYHIDALQILTPDVMHALVEYGKDYDFELIGNELYVYQGSWMAGTPFDSEEKMRQFLMVVEHISEQFGQQVERYSDVRAGNVASGLVAAEGAKFKRKSTIVTSTIITFIIVAVILAVQLLF